MFETLFAKTFAILGSQLLITWGATVLVINKVTELYYAKTPGITGSTNKDGLLDLEIDWSGIKPYNIMVLVLNIIVFLLLLFIGKHNLSIGIPLFTIWSILTGINLAFVLISVDENLGTKVLAITLTVTLASALFGIYSGIDFGFMGGFLFIALLLLLAGNLVRLFIAIPRANQRVMAFFGVIIFTGYLLFDFNRLAKLEETVGANSWSVAMELSISIYLDIINIFLFLLDLMSE